MSRMNRSTFEGLIKENLEWLAQQLRTLEREHIRVIVEQSPTAFYGADVEEMAALKARADAAQKKLEALAEAYSAMADAEEAAAETMKEIFDSSAEDTAAAIQRHHNACTKHQLARAAYEAAALRAARGET